MSPALLDVNVLLALFDADHVDHQRAHSWLDGQIGHGWTSCPITENGFVRIISQPRYPSPIAPALAIELLAEASRDRHHTFWPCDISLLGDQIVDHTHLHGPRQVTDAYLLALAVAHEGRFATFDTAISLSAVRGAQQHHLMVI